MEVTVTQFKAKCLAIVQKVQEEKCRVLVTRHGRPAAEIVPVSRSKSRSWLGRAKGRTHFRGDVFSTGECWDAGH
jgi:prevent-host-death family protein